MTIEEKLPDICPCPIVQDGKLKLEEFADNKLWYVTVRNASNIGAWVTSSTKRLPPIQNILHGPFGVSPKEAIEKWNALVSMKVQRVSDEPFPDES